MNSRASQIFGWFSVVQKYEQKEILIRQKVTQLYVMLTKRLVIVNKGLTRMQFQGVADVT